MYMLLWGKFVLYKYVTCWLVTEGVCILTGLGFNDFDERGKAKWDACANMKVWLFETTPLHRHHRLIQHQHQCLGGPLFSNDSSSLEIKNYPRDSHCSLGPLAWTTLRIPGLLPDGIPHCYCGKTGCPPNSGEPNPEQPGFHYCPATFLLLGAADHPLALHGLLDDCLLPLTWDKWFKVYKSIYFLGHVFFLSLLFILPYVHKAMVPRKEKLKKMG